MESVWRLLTEKLFPVDSTDRLFNQYKDEDPALDLPGAVQIRRENLRAYLSSYPAHPALLMVGEAPGPWGCRFSGVPFTGEAQLCSGELAFVGRQSSISPHPYREMSGKLVWELVRLHHPDVFVWNCVPLHPHRPGEPLSIRTPTPREVALHADLLAQLHALLAPRSVVAVGRVAERALEHIGVTARYVRHPSQGGAPQFREGMKSTLRDAGLEAASS